MAALTAAGNVGYVILPSPKDIPIYGGLFYGPTSTTVPTDLLDPDDVGFALKHLGFVSEEGIDETEARPSTKIFAWGGDTVAVTQDSYSLSETFTLYEFLNPNVAEYAYGVDNVDVTAATSTAGTKMTIKVNSDLFKPHVWLSDTYGVGGKRVQTFVPMAQIMSKDTKKTNHKTVLAHRITLEAFPDSFGNNAYILTDDGVFSV